MLLECEDCSWRGEQEECNKGYSLLPDMDIEPSITCPKCGSENLREIGRDHAKLQTIPY